MRVPLSNHGKNIRLPKPKRIKKGWRENFTPTLFIKCNLLRDYLRRRVTTPIKPNPSNASELGSGIPAGAPIESKVSPLMPASWLALAEKY